MLTTMIVLLVIAIVLGIVGFSAAVVAVKVLFWIFLALFIISVIAWAINPGGRRGIAT